MTSNLLLQQISCQVSFPPEFFHEVFEPKHERQLKFTESDRWVQRLQRLPKTVCQMEKDNKIQAFDHKKTFQDIRIYQKKNMLDLRVQHVLTTQINFTATSFPTLSDIYLDPRCQQTWTLACNQLVGTSTCRVLCQSACSVLTLML